MVWRALLSEAKSAFGGGALLTMFRVNKTPYVGRFVERKLGVN
jgi:hypothetical protein